MTHRNTRTPRLLPALLLLAGLALLATSCSPPAAAVPATATAAPAQADAATSVPTTQPALTVTPSTLSTPGTSTSPLPVPHPSTSPLPASGSCRGSDRDAAHGRSGRSSEQWSIYPDGRVLAPKGTQSQVGAAEVSALLAALDKAGFFALEDSYGKNSPCRDCYNYQLSVYENGRAKTVAFVEGASDIPPGLTASLKAINDLVTLAGQ